MKKIICTVLSVLIFACLFSVPGSADAPASSEPEVFLEIGFTRDEARHIAGGSLTFRKMLREIFVSRLETDGYEKGLDFFRDMALENEEEVDWLFFPEEDWKLLKSGKNVLISVTAPHTTEKFSFITREEQNAYDRFYFVIILNDGTEIEKWCHMSEGPITLAEIMDDCEISDPKQIGFLYVQMSYFYFDLSQVSISVTPCENGWNEIGGNRYYIKSDGTIITKSTVIGGIRYQFGKDGVCQGKYTGFTRSEKGRRYWKNGELVKNDWIRVKGERTYYAGADGYFVTGTREIDGKEYSFDENGAVRG